MKIKPVKKYPGILPAAAALLTSIVTGCDRQNVVGIVPNPHRDDVPSQLPGEPPEMPAPTEPAAPVESPTAAEPEEEPQLLGGDVPAENIWRDSDQEE
jgi:hypothetical protein